MKHCDTLRPRRFLERFALAAISLAVVGVVSAAGPRALPKGQKPKDDRLTKIRTLNSYFPFQKVESTAAWKERAGELRRRVLVATGLWPLPERTPLNAVVHGKVDRDDYTVERAFLESLPGHYVTGSLYRPKGKSEKRPAVLTPHGHWPSGRFHDHGEPKGKKLVASGEEERLPEGRHHLQSRCVQLARMGCVVFLYDMVGYADHNQLPHRAGFRQHMNTRENWGYFSPQAELRLQNMMALQTWNTVRALDFLLSLPDVDPDRVAVTGASGGGTQTFILFAIDKRPKVSAPAVMVSTAMQGGCTCENAPYLRIGAGNVDLAALAAPRAQFLVGANDWTKAIETKGLPDLKNLYAMLGKPENIEGKSLLQFGHNYNAVSRQLVYHWINRQLGLGIKEPIHERRYKPLSRKEATVWTTEHPAPSGEKRGEPHERTLLGNMTKAAKKQMAALTPKDKKSLAEYRRVVGGAFETIVDRRLDSVGKIEYELAEKLKRDDHLLMSATLTVPKFKEQVPTLYFHPKENWNGEVVIWVTDTGKDALTDDKGQPVAEVKQLLAASFSIAGLDVFGQGEFTDDGKPLASARVQKGRGRRGFIGYTHGYNHPLFVQRVHDVLTMIRFVQTDEHKAKRIHLVGFGPVAGPLAAAARSQAGDIVDKTAIDTAGFRFASANRLDHPMLVPGAVKYNDVPGLLSLCTPHKLWLADGKQGLPAVVVAAYRAAGARAKLIETKKPEAKKAAIQWLIGKKTGEISSS